MLAQKGFFGKEPIDFWLNQVWEMNHIVSYIVSGFPQVVARVSKLDRVAAFTASSAEKCPETQSVVDLNFFLSVW